MTGAIADCERVIDAIWGQPVNSLTALAFVIMGGIVLIRTSRRWVGVASIATGLGSFLFHGPMIAGAGWAHDASLAWLLVVAGTSGTRLQRWGTWPALIVLSAWVAATPEVIDLVSALLAAGAIGSILLRDRSPRTLMALAVLGVAALVGRLSATGGPWCQPDSVLQGHGFWHVAAAAAVGLWATGDPHAGSPGSPGSR